MHFVNTVDLSKSLNLLKFSLESMTVLLSSSKQLQWNFDLRKCQETGKLVRYIEVFSIHYTITGLINIVRYTEDFAI